MILWTDVSNTLAELSHTVEQRDVNSLLSGNLQNEVVFRQLTEVGARADLLKYEVSVYLLLSEQVRLCFPDCFPIWRNLP